MFSPRIKYTFLLWLLLPYVFIHLLWRARKQIEYLNHIPERFGFYKVQSDNLVIWLHTVSVGETRAAASLVQRLQAAYPEHQLLLTHTTPTGREASEQLYGDKVMRVYLPYDYPFAVKLFLRHFKPRTGILLETEIWPNIIHHSRSAKVPLLLLNARLSEKSYTRYSRFPNLSLACLSQLHTVSAQTEEDAARLGKLGAQNISVMGNLKYDIEPPSAMLTTGEQLRHLFGTNRPVFLAASTREGEEEILLQALKQLDMPDLLTIIVPRHPQRFNEVAELLAKQNFSFQRRTENRPTAPQTQVVLGDSMGEMFGYYAACDIAFIGGSLLPYGGQNLIEACAVGKPVIIGPHTYNFSQASDLAVNAGAATRVKDAKELVATVHELLTHPQRMTKMGEAGVAFVKANQGATDRALTVIAQVIPRLK